MQKASPVETGAVPIPSIKNWRPLTFTALVALALFTLRLSAPPNLLDQDQENPAAYVLDMVKNGNWICQRDLSGNITSKPPLYTWSAALVTVACGRISLFSLYLPGALALFGTASLVFRYGQRHFGPRAAFFGALACMLCTAGLKQFGLARTDGVFAFTVTAGAFLAYVAWTRGRGWTWFWLIAAAATLTKGPLGLVLASAGLLAYYWERHSAQPLPLRGSQVAGVALFLIITVGWLGLAYWQLGRAVIDKLFLQELVFHVVEGEQKKLPGTQFYLSPLYYLGRAAPWSLLAYFGLWQIWRFPASNVTERRFERFLFCWFLGGLVLFSMAPHQRGDLLWPIMPAGALIAGRELARLTDGFAAVKIHRTVVLGVILAVMGFGCYYFGPHARHPLARQTVALQKLAQQIESQGGKDFPLAHTDDPTALQIDLNTWHPPISFEAAAALLRGREAAYVAVTDWARLQSALRPDAPPVYTVLADQGPVDKLKVRIVSNRRLLSLKAAAETPNRAP
jgi:4-amino-4-deoxy-L-arabinose transferase-like glycosyltransferase